MVTSLIGTKSIIYKFNFLYDFMIAVILALFLLLSLSGTCFARSADEDKVYALYHKYRQIFEQGQYQEALKYAKMLVPAGEKAYGKNHPNVAIFLNNLAERYRSIGEYSKAEPLYKRSLSINRKAFGSENPQLAKGLNNLALLYNATGDYRQAEQYFKESLKIKEKVLGPEHPSVALGLNNLAVLYREIGDYNRAKNLYQKALSIMEKALGPEHLQYAQGLNNLAELYRKSGDYEKAKQICKKSLAIKEKTLGPKHPIVANGQFNLAIIYRNMGDSAAAERLYKKSIATMEATIGSRHPVVAQGYNNLGELYLSTGDYNQARLNLEKALQIKKKSLGSEHPEVVVSLLNLAIIYAVKNDFKKAFRLLKRAQVIDTKTIDQVMGFTSEQQKIRYLSSKKQSLYFFLSFIAQFLSDDQSARQEALNFWLKRKGVVLETQKRYQEALIYSDSREAIQTFNDLSSVRASLSRYSFAGPGKEDKDTYKKRLAHLETQKDMLEAKLSQLSQAFALNRKIAKADCMKLAEALPPNSILLDFARIEMFNFSANVKKMRWHPAHYLGFVLHARKGNQVVMIDLGDAEKIDRTIAEFKIQLAKLKNPEENRIFQLSRNIYELVFAPIRKEIGGKKEIFISSDGNLNLIPFEVLQGPDGKYLIETYLFNYLAASRDVLGFEQFKCKSSMALLIGDPDFDMSSDGRNVMLKKPVLSTDPGEMKAMRAMDMRGLHFTRLPGTRQEVEAIYKILGSSMAELYTGKKALEEVLRQKKAPKYLHLATHGFFLQDLDLSRLPDDLLNRGMQSVFIAPKAIPHNKIKVKNPLLRSGFALAGANKTLESGDIETCDGIVTAEKILGLQLRGTDMVVLSACETGVGEVKIGEGVFGLQRAFTQAGAKSLVMSFWNVPDRETKELMVEFYKNIQSGKMNRCQALRQAALKEMKVVKERYGHTHPFFWGAFVFRGEP